MIVNHNLSSIINTAKRNAISKEKGWADTERSIEGGSGRRMLYDRFVHLEFEQKIEHIPALAEKLGETEDLKILSPSKFQNALNKNIDQYTVYTPETGVKPDITVKVKFLVSDRVSEVSVVIKNLEREINFGDFAFMRVYMGYFHGPSTVFFGPIMNAYIESPNPNGSTVIQMFDGGFLGHTIIPRKISFRTNQTTGIIDCIETLCRNTNTPLFYCKGVTDSMLYYVNKVQIFDSECEQTYGSVKEGLDSFITMWNNIVDRVNFGTLLQEESEREARYNFIREVGNTKLNYVSRTEGIYISITTATLPEEELPTFDFVKSAAFTGGGITIKSVFNPWIRPLDPFFIDPVYFRGRFNSVNIRNLQVGNEALLGFTIVEGKVKSENVVGVSPEGKYICTGLTVDFGTISSNDMIVEGVVATGDDFEKHIKELAEKIPGLADGTSLGADLSSATLPLGVRPALKEPIDEDWSTNSPVDTSKLKVIRIKSTDRPVDVFGITLWQILVNPDYGYQDKNPFKDYLYMYNYNIINGEVPVKDIPGFPVRSNGYFDYIEVHYPKIWESSTWHPYDFIVEDYGGVKDVFNVELLLPYLPSGVFINPSTRKNVSYIIYPEKIKDAAKKYGDMFTGDPIVLDFRYPAKTIDGGYDYKYPGSWFNFANQFINRANFLDAYNAYKVAQDKVQRKVREFEMPLTAIGAFTSLGNYIKWTEPKKIGTNVHVVPRGCVDFYDLDYLVIAVQGMNYYKASFYFPKFEEIMKFNPNAAEFLDSIAQWCMNIKLPSYARYATDLGVASRMIRMLDGVSL
jgi:hypothetical protein